MRVYVDPVPKLSIAMRRVALALRLTAPAGVEVVDEPSRADVQVLHAVGPDALRHLRAPSYAMVQYALLAESRDGRNVRLDRPAEAWAPLWAGARAVWTYYDLSGHAPAGTPMYLAPLGVAAEFLKGPANKDIGVVTSGYLSGPGAEPIEEVALAAHKAGLVTVHVGPTAVDGMTRRVPGWHAVSGLTDAALATLLGRARWVSGMRYVEGYELPAFEGLACGARPVAFDLPCYRQWLDGHAAFVPELEGDDLVAVLADVFARPPRPVLPDERSAMMERHDWAKLCAGFWDVLLQSEGSGRSVPRPAAGRPVLVHSVPSRPRVLWVGDSPTTAWTGFGRATFEILRVLCRDYDVTAIGTTHDGAPYDRATIPYDVYPLSHGVTKVVNRVRPDLVFIQHDPWVLPQFLPAMGGVPTVGVVPIDGENCRCGQLNGLALVVWWTEFARRAGAAGGYGGPSTVIPLGVDLENFRPRDKRDARRKVVGLSADLDDAFIVGCVARNQPRKRLDLVVRHFAEWVRSRDIGDAYLYLQTAPTAEAAYDIVELMAYEGLQPRLLHDDRDARDPAHETSMSYVYSAMDVYFTATQGEGFGLPVLEAMACGVPVVAPDWAALGDWARPAAHLVPVAETSGTIRMLGSSAKQTCAVLGGVPDRRANVEALDRLYRDEGYREALRGAGLALAAEDRYRWESIGRRFAETVAAVLGSRGPALKVGADVPEETVEV